LKFLVKRQGQSRSWCTKTGPTNARPPPRPTLLRPKPQWPRSTDVLKSYLAQITRDGETDAHEQRRRRAPVPTRGGWWASASAAEASFTRMRIMPGRRKGSASVPAIYPDSRRRGAGPAIRIFVQRSFRARRGRGRSQSKHYCCLCVL
jgi:hypothetical protein